MSSRGPTRGELAATFASPDVVDAYQHRSPYPAAVFDILTGLIADRPRDVLDIGAGEGALSRPLASRVDHVDALDISAAMLAAGAGRPGGAAPNLRWILGAAETADLSGPYALVIAGASLHWMAWETTLSRLAAVLTDHAVLAIVEHGPRDLPWRDELTEVIVRHSRSRDYDPGFSLPDQLAKRGLLRIDGHAATEPVPFRQPVASYVEHFHSTASLARSWMTVAETAAFDRAVEEVVAPYAVHGVLDLTVAATMTWGRPMAAARS